jgi:hypothetical protein
MNMTLVIAEKEPHVSQDAVEEFQNAILAANGLRTVRNQFPLFARLVWKLLRSNISAKAFRYFPLTNQRYFIILMGSEFVKCVPFFASSRDNALYIFDAWPPVHQLIEDSLSLLHIHTVFFSSMQATEIFSAKPGLECKCFWVPEGIDVDLYQRRDLHERNIDVIQMGRKHDGYHAAIVENLREAGKTYLFEKVRGGVIFPTRDGFIDGLSRSKISICVPGCLTHPERSGNISTMTLRYLQSMASGCLLVGVRPYDMQFLFDYNPVVEIDFNDPVGQLLEILGHIDQYRPLIDRNYNTVRERHTWFHRWEEIRRRLSQE